MKKYVKNKTDNTIDYQLKLVNYIQELLPEKVVGLTLVSNSEDEMIIDVQYYDQIVEYYVPYEDLTNNIEQDAQYILDEII